MNEVVERAHLPIEWAKAILEMAAVCYSEGQGPDYSEILTYIACKYPELMSDYTWLLPKKE